MTFLPLYFSPAYDPLAIRMSGVENTKTWELGIRLLNSTTVVDKRNKPDYN